MKLQYPERMTCQYTLAKDLSDRLDGTVCRYDGRVVRVYNSFPTVTLYEWDSRKIKEIEPSDPLFDISAIETGYFNYECPEYSFVGYASRSPIKKYKAALFANYVEYRTIGGGQVIEYMKEGFYSQGMLDSLEGRFPSYIEAMELLKQRNEVAISQDVAFRKDEMGATYVYHRTVPVGWIAPGDHKVHVVDNDLRWVVNRILSRMGLY